MGRHWGEDWGDDYPHRDITEAIIQAAIRLQKTLGPGILEDAYKVCLAQLNNYLHFSSFEVGLLLNFHNWPLKDGGIKRLINTKA